jgi:hypothetical protein
VYFYLAEFDIVRSNKNFLANYITMTLLNIKNIAFVSALVSGSFLSVGVNAQSLITSFPSVSTGTTASGTTVTSVSSAPYTISAVSNSFTITAGHDYTLVYSASTTPTNGAFRFSTNGVAGGAFNGTIVASISSGTYTALISAASISALVGQTLYLRINGGSSSSWTLDLTSLTDTTPPAPSGPSTANTQQSLVNTAQTLQGTYTLQNSILANSFSYDCSVFGENNVCVSAGGRNTAVSAANGLNNSSALLIAAYRAMANVRIGAYADQNVSASNSSTVNLGNNTPLLGLFGVWSERLDGTGTEVKASLAYGQKNTTINRSAVGTGATASEAGSGGSQLNSQGAQVTAKYGFGVVDKVVVSPYVGIRYTQNNMGGYTEGASSSVTAPLTYSALNTNATTALAGVGANYRGIPQTTLFVSAGVETDTNTSNGSYSATGLTGLTPVNFNSNPVRTRPTATLGATYDVEKNQRVGVTGIYRQEAYQATATTTVMATYTVGF